MLCSKDRRETMRGYKPGVPRGILDDARIAEEIVFGTLKTHGLEQCREMLKNTSCLHENDILINDRWFLSREMASYLKIERRADTYIPARENMIACQDAVKLAAASGKWQKHPNRKRKDQEIQLVTDLGQLWERDEPETDVPINTCVVHDKKDRQIFCIHDNRHRQDCTADHKYLRTAPGNRRGFPTDERFLETGRLQEYKIQLYYLPYRNDAGGIPVFPDIQKLGRRENICREVPASRSEGLQGDKA